MFAVQGAWRFQLREFGLDTVIYCAPLTPVPVLTLSNAVERVSFECRRHVVSLLFHCDVNVLVPCVN